MTVRCSEYKDCGDLGCMHWDEHKPLSIGTIRDRQVIFCDDVESMCLRRTTKCVLVRNNPAKVEAELVKV